MAAGASAGGAGGFIARVAEAAADRAAILVERWLPAGKRRGTEWLCGDLSGAEGESLSISISGSHAGRWADFASDARGGDLVSLYAAIHNLKQGEAARAVAEELGLRLDESPRAEKVQAIWKDAGAWPADGPPAPRAHPYRGPPEGAWAYFDAGGAILGYACRFKTSDGGKEVLPLVWSSGPKGRLAWRWRAFDQPRPLYAQDFLARRPRAPVLVVEGEKKAQAAQQVLGEAWVVTTWPGGCKAVAKANLAPLRGRRLVLWPDCDAKTGEDRALLPEERQPGVAAMEKLAARLPPDADVWIVSIPAPGDRKDGWDVADLIEEMGERAPEAVQRWLAPDRLRRPRSRAQQDLGGDESGDWRRRLQRNDSGRLAKTDDNIIEILRNDERWTGVIAHDEFSARTMKRAPPPYRGACAGRWESDDDLWTTAWLQHEYRQPASVQLVAPVVEALARQNCYHPVRDHLRSLTWDGVERLDHWLVDVAGIDDTEYARAVSRYFLRGMVRRVMEPGCKFDYCLVLEGEEGLRKSSMAAALGEPWASDTPLDLTHKDSMAGIVGKWVHEFSEMESVTRAEAHLQKSFLSRQVDEYRPVYAKRHVSHPRQCVFIGTTNEVEYIKEGQGARRFWPVRVPGQIDVDALRAMRDQLFAQAVVDYDAGAPTFPNEQEQRELFTPEQRRRVLQESLVDALHDWVLSPDGDQLQARAANGGMFSLAEAAVKGLHISYAQLTRDVEVRVGRALRALGCRKVEKRNGMTRFWYKAPPTGMTATASAHLVNTVEEAALHAQQVEEPPPPF